MATVSAVLLQLWCMWWHFWPSGELYNAGVVQSPDRPCLSCLSCPYCLSYSEPYRSTVSFDRGAMTTDSPAKSQTDKIRAAYLCHGNKIKSQQSYRDQHQIAVTTGIPGITGIMCSVMSVYVIIDCSLCRLILIRQLILRQSYSPLPVTVTIS